jgi:hypothetical protein
MLKEAKMRTRRARYAIYFATVVSLSLLLFIGLLTAPLIALLAGGVLIYLGFLLPHVLLGLQPSPLSWPLCGLLVFCQLVVLTLPTLGALRSRGEKVYLWLVAQFIVLVVYLLVNVCLVLQPRS